MRQGIQKRRLVTRAEATAEVQPLTNRKLWKALETHYEKPGKIHLRELFAQDAERGVQMTAEAVGILLDYSNSRITDETIQ
jgi:glucose-6-phosphate isomerase